MALTKANFNNIGSQSGGPALYTYNSGADNVAAVQAANYFDGVADLIKSPSFMMVIASDATKIYKVTKSGSVVTLSTGQAIA